MFCWSEAERSCPNICRFSRRLRIWLAASEPWRSLTHVKTAQLGEMDEEYHGEAAHHDGDQRPGDHPRAALGSDGLAGPPTGEDEDCDTDRKGDEGRWQGEVHGFSASELTPCSVFSQR